MKFLRFWSKKRIFNFCGFFFPAVWKSRHRKKKFCITGGDVTINNWCTSQWSLEVKKYSILWKVFKHYSFWIRIWLTSNLFYETIFSLFSRSILLTGNTKSTVGSISVLNLWYFGYIFLMLNLHTLSCNIFFLKELWLKAVIFNSFSIM